MSTPPPIPPQSTKPVSHSAPRPSRRIIADEPGAADIPVAAQQTGASAPGNPFGGAPSPAPVESDEQLARRLQAEEDAAFAVRLQRASLQGPPPGLTPSELRAHQLGDQSSTEPDPAAPLAPPHHLPQTNQNFQIYRQPTMPPGSGTAAAAAIYHASAPASRPGTAIAQPTVYYAAQPQGVISQPPIILQSMPVAPMIIQQPAGPSTQSFGPLRNTIPPLRPHPAQYPLSGPPPRGKGWCLTCAATGVVMSNGIEVYCPACGYGTLVDLPDGVQGSVECPGCAGNGVLNDEGRDRSIVGTVGSAVQAIGNEIAGLLGRERQTKPTISGPLAYCGMCRGSGLVNPQVVVVGQPVVAVPAGQPLPQAQTQPQTQPYLPQPTTQSQPAQRPPPTTQSAQPSQHSQPSTNPPLPPRTAVPTSGSGSGTGTTGSTGQGNPFTR